MLAQTNTEGASFENRLFFSHQKNKLFCSFDKEKGSIFSCQLSPTHPNPALLPQNLRVPAQT